MTYEVTTYSIIYLLIAIMCATAAPLAWRRRDTPGLLWLFLMLVAIVEWTLGIALEQSVVEFNGHVFWAQASYVGSTTLPVFLFLFAMEYTGKNKRITSRTIAPLFIVPAVTVVAVFTNDWHNLVWTSVTPASSPAEHLYLYGHGTLYWVITAYSFALLGIATVALARFAIRNRNLYRYQSAGIILAIVIPWVAEIVYDAKPDIFSGLDPSPTMAASGVILTICIVRFRLLDLVPVAREALVESMVDGLLVLDARSRIVDFNPAARRQFNFPLQNLIGKQSAEAFGYWPAVAAWLSEPRNHEDEVTLLSPDERYMNVRVSALVDRNGARKGYITLFRDVTSLKHTEMKLQSTAEDLQSRLSEIESLQAELREHAIRDPLTTLFNRRYLSENLEREFARAAREKYPVSLVMIDIDGFKSVNDILGHAAGDLILRSFGEQLRAQTRAGDFACRYGGDEFLVVLPNTTEQQAFQKAEQWRNSLASMVVPIDDTRLSVTASQGIAALPQHGQTADEVLTAADDAVYLAKAQGRNRIVTATRSAPSLKHL